MIWIPSAGLLASSLLESTILGVCVYFTCHVTRYRRPHRKYYFKGKKSASRKTSIIASMGTVPDGL